MEVGYVCGRGAAGAGYVMAKAAIVGGGGGGSGVYGGKAGLCRHLEEEWSEIEGWWVRGFEEMFKWEEASKTVGKSA